MPSGIARICNDARAAKTRFYVLHSVKHYTRVTASLAALLHLDFRQPEEFAKLNRVGKRTVNPS